VILTRGFGSIHLVKYSTATHYVFVISLGGC
jgi:hypothetical protein